MVVSTTGKDEILNVVSAAAYHSAMENAGLIPYWTVESMLPNYPGIIVARLCTTLAHGNGVTVEPTAYAAVLIAPSIEHIRGLLPPGLLRLPRSKQDEWTVIERWMS